MYVNLINFTTFVQKTTSYFDSTIELEKKRALYENKGVFSPKFIDGIASLKIVQRLRYSRRSNKQP